MLIYAQHIFLLFVPFRFGFMHYKKRAIVWHEIQKIFPEIAAENQHNLMKYNFSWAVKNILS